MALGCWFVLFNSTRLQTTKVNTCQMFNNKVVQIKIIFKKDKYLFYNVVGYTV